MTPSIYASVGRRYMSKKIVLWAMATLALFVVFISVIGASKIDTIIPHQLLFGMGALLSIITWGMLLTVYWYAPDGKMAPEKVKDERGIKKVTHQFISWVGAIFLSFWFISGISVLPWLLWKQVTNA